MTAAKRTHAKNAFTLVELVTVVAILGIMAAAVGGPTLSYMDLMRTRAAAARVAGDIRFAQRTAMASGQRTWVTFSTSSNNYRLYIEDPANPGEAGRQALVHPYDQSSAAIVFGAGAFVNVNLVSVGINGGAEIEFDNFGVPCDAAGIALASSGVITLSNGVTITILPVSGFVERAG